jgi:hypothetical protein
MNRTRSIRSRWYIAGLAKTWLFCKSLTGRFYWQVFPAKQVFAHRAHLVAKEVYWQFGNWQFIRQFPKSFKALITNFIVYFVL